MIRVGPAGWSYRDWEGIVYPAPRSRGPVPLATVARMFDLVEVNSTFYHPPKPEVAEAWCRLLDRIDAERFRFSVKMWRGLTHDEEPTSHEEAGRLREVCQVLRERGRLLAVLAQFPWSFKSSPVSRARLARVAEDWAELGLAIEMRHASWDTEEFLAWLREQGLAFVNIDQPALADNLVPTAHVTSPRLAYVRLHGRNREAWFSEDAGPDERYNHLYSSEELAPWAVRIGQMSERAEQTIVVTNNHFRGQAIANALELQAAAIPDRDVAVPPTLVEQYPHLREVPGLRLATEEDLAMPPERAGEETGQLEMF